MNTPEELIVILDFGSQYTQLIARRIREQKVFCKILPFNSKTDLNKEKNLKGIILSGGPASVFDEGAPLLDRKILELNVPVLGICYGLQVIAHLLGGKVEKGRKGEYGRAIIEIKDSSDLFKGLGKKEKVWMSHGDFVVNLPQGYQAFATTESIPYVAVKNPERKIYGLQFHPEVVHTENGKIMLQNFLFDICECKGTWTSESFISASVEKIKDTVGNGKVICGVSGGIDSFVCALLVNKAAGAQLTSIFIDNGLLRKNEVSEVIQASQKLNMKLDFVDASQRFLSALKGVTDPEEKRKIIGRVFIEVFEKEAEKIGQVDFLAQGTLYPDLIESISFKGPSATIKTHHNVGGLPEVMNLRLIEPLKELFKDEVRRIGEELDLSDWILQRHPFPGPGLAVRVIGEVVKKELDLLREVDEIFIGELKNSGYYDKVWQAFCVLLPVRSVGVMGDERTYENVIALRTVTSTDGMTADWGRLPFDVIGKISNRIINEVKGINRVVYDISSKPPATIEWE